MKINFKEGLTRIYILFSILWSIFWLIVAISDKDLLSLFVGLILPVIVYFTIVWIVKGFLNNP